MGCTALIPALGSAGSMRNIQIFLLQLSGALPAIPRISQLGVLPSTILPQRNLFLQLVNQEGEGESNSSFFK